MRLAKIRKLDSAQCWQEWEPLELCALLDSVDSQPFLRAFYKYLIDLPKEAFKAKDIFRHLKEFIRHKKYYLLRLKQDKDISSHHFYLQ